MPHTLVSDMNFPFGEREEFPTSIEYTGIFLEVLIQYLVLDYPASRHHGV